MAGDITKFDFSDNLRNNLGLQNVQPPINKVASFVQPVAEIIKYSNFVRHTSAVNSSATIFTTDANRDTYVTGFVFTVIADAASDGTTYQLRCFVNGAARYFGNVRKVTLTACDKTISLSLPFPVKLDRNTAVTLSLDTSAAGNAVMTGTVFGFEI